MLRNSMRSFRRRISQIGRDLLPHVVRRSLGPPHMIELCPQVQYGLTRKDLARYVAQIYLHDNRLWTCAAYLMLLGHFFYGLLCRGATMARAGEGSVLFAGVLVPLFFRSCWWEGHQME